jgi:hypothetical protein
MEVTRPQPSVGFRAILCIPIACAFLMSPVTVYALLYWGKPSLPRMMEQILEVPAEEFTRLDQECAKELGKLVGPPATEEGPLREALLAFCSCDSNTTIVVRLKAEQFFEHRLREVGRKLQENGTKEIPVWDRLYEGKHSGLSARIRSPEGLVQQYSVMLRSLEEEKDEFYRQSYNASMGQCVRILAPWEGHYAPEIQNYLRTRSGLPSDFPPNLKQAPSSQRRLARQH